MIWFLVESIVCHVCRSIVLNVSICVHQRCPTAPLRHFPTMTVCVDPPCLYRSIRMTSSHASRVKLFVLFVLFVRRDCRSSTVRSRPSAVVFLRSRHAFQGGVTTSRCDSKRPSYLIFYVLNSDPPFCVFPCPLTLPLSLDLPFQHRSSANLSHAT